MMQPQSAFESMMLGESTAAIPYPWTTIDMAKSPFVSQRGTEST